jgi:PAS domain S-box-containing protein
MENKLRIVANNLDRAQKKLDTSELDAILTEAGPLLIGDARFSVPFSEARYRCLINRLGVLVLELTVSGHIVYSNEITNQLLGITPQELLGSSCLDLIYPSRSDISMQTLRSEFIADLELINYETCIVTQDGSRKVISWNTFDVFNCEHQLERIVYFGIDITEQQIAEQNLAIAAIAFDTSLAMTIFNPGGELLRVNAAYTLLTGYTTEQLVGKSHHWLKSDLNSEEFYAKKQAIIADTGIWSGEIWSQRKGDQDYQEYRSIQAVKNNAGILTHYVGSHEDITERKRQEERLSIGSVAFNAGQSMFVTDAKGVITHANPSFLKQSGYSLEELIGNTPNIFKSGCQDADFYVQMWKELLKEGRWCGELWNKNKSGELTLEQLNIVQVIGTDFKATHYVSTLTDISKLKAYETGLIEAKEKAERFSILKTQFIASMSHEIRTPMAAIIGFSELALYEDMNEEVRIYLQDINVSSNSLLGILNDILDFTKLETGYIVIEYLPLDINELMNSVNTLFKGSAQQKGLDFTIRHDSNIPLEVLGDKLRVQQVLTNLIGNAIKFTAQGYVKLDITLQNMSSTQVQLLFSVSDSGIGIAFEDQDKLFKEFSQVDGSFTREYGGSGLGLVISKELVELMGGEISVTSEKGMGSTFSFALSFDIVKKSIDYTGVASTLSKKLPSELYANKFKGFHALVVEDNAYSQTMIQKYLLVLGMHCKIASHGEDALRLLEEHDFDLVLMDIHMPVMNGIVTTERIRLQAKYNNLPIIALSAGVTETERNNCIACGMVGFISKPINFEQLCSVIDLWLKPSSLGVQ